LILQASWADKFLLLIFFVKSKNYKYFSTTGKKSWSSQAQPPSVEEPKNSPKRSTSGPTTQRANQE
jgi:hypothetical protein